MTYLEADVTPDWVTYADRVTDISDVWAEATDPEQERGEVCMAYFDAATPVRQRPSGDYPTDKPFDAADGMRLVGIAIVDTTGTIYRGREWATKVLGPDTVWNVERYEMETPE